MDASAPRPADPALALRGLRQSFPVALGLRRREVLLGVDLELAAGQSLGLVGPNGSGKSTLLRILAGVDRADSGELRVLGGDPLSKAIKLRVGFLPEDSPFPREVRALEVLRLLGSLHGMPGARARERGRELLVRVGLGEHQRTPLARFSRGMLRRFGLAQAVLHEPDLLLLDEPTAGLDALGFGVLDELLAEARGRGASIVVSSHLLTDLHAHCDRLAVIVGGRVAAAGAPAELLGGAATGGRTEIELEGLKAADLEALRREVEARGGTWIGVQPSQANLIALYRDPRRASGGSSG